MKNVDADLNVRITWVVCRFGPFLFDLLLDQCANLRIVYFKDIDSFWFFLFIYLFFCTLTFDYSFFQCLNNMVDGFILFKHQPMILFNFGLNFFGVHIRFIKRHKKLSEFCVSIWRNISIKLLLVFKRLETLEVNALFFLCPVLNFLCLPLNLDFLLWWRISRK